MGIAIHNKFIATVTALGILITGISASQVQAQSSDRERALAALLGLAVIGAIIADAKDDDDRKANRVTRRKPVTIEPRPLPRRVTKRALPAQCLREVYTDRGRSRFYGQRCMERNYRYVNQLPSRCERVVRSDRGVRYGWGAGCLRNNGYQIARR